MEDCSVQMHDMVNALHHIRDQPSVSTWLTDGQRWWRVVLSNLRWLHCPHLHRHLADFLLEELGSWQDHWKEIIKYDWGDEDFVKDFIEIQNSTFKFNFIAWQKTWIVIIDLCFKSSVICGFYHLLIGVWGINRGSACFVWGDPSIDPLRPNSDRQI